MNHDWKPIKLGALLEKVSRPVALAPGNAYRLLGAHWYAKGLYVKGVKKGGEIRAETLFEVREDDFVYNRLFAWRGAFAVAGETEDGCFVSNEFPCFAIRKNQIDPRFLWFYFSRASAWTEALGLSSGSTPTSRNRLKEPQFLNMEIPLPPLDEQRRIVSRIEELGAKVEDARGLRHHAAEEVEELKQSGTARLFSNLDGARPAKIEETCEVRGGIQKSSARTPGANPRRYITVAHVQRNSIDAGDPRYFEVSDEELERWRLLPGDVLVIEGNGSFDQIGRTALFRGEIEDCVHQNHVIRVRPDRSKLMPEYLNVYLNSPVGKGQMLERSRTTSGLFNLSVGRIKALEIPLPPLAEQQRIVAYLDNLQAKVDSLKKLQSETAAELDALMPSILDKAFRGEL